MHTLLRLILVILLTIPLSVANAQNMPAPNSKLAVNKNEIPPLPSKIKIKKIEQELSDSVITTKITAKYTKNKNLNPLKISVTTSNGVVKLNGAVKDKDAFVDALRLAKNTKGVKSVDAENLTIKIVNTAFTDAYITAKVEAALLKAKVLDDESIPIVGINAKTINGTVTLSGEVKNQSSISVILRRVNAIKGVKKIISELQIRDHG